MNPISPDSPPTAAPHEVLAYIKHHMQKSNWIPASEVTEPGWYWRRGKFTKCLSMVKVVISKGDFRLIDEGVEEDETSLLLEWIGHEFQRVADPLP